jgi:hypothetical protein
MITLHTGLLLGSLCLGEALLVSNLNLSVALDLPPSRKDEQVAYLILNLPPQSESGL